MNDTLTKLTRLLESYNTLMLGFKLDGTPLKGLQKDLVAMFDKAEPNKEYHITAVKIYPDADKVVLQELMADARYVHITFEPKGLVFLPGRATQFDYVGLHVKPSIEFFDYINGLKRHLHHEPIESQTFHVSLLRMPKSSNTEAKAALEKYKPTLPKVLNPTEVALFDQKGQPALAMEMS